MGPAAKTSTPVSVESWRPTSKRRGRCVLHVDVDAFFAQVEQLRDESLRGIPIAIRQHGDIICVCHRARHLGARKHDGVAKCKDLVEQHGGRVVHVHTTEDQLVSYEPYIRASYELHAKMAAVCERLRVNGKHVIYEKASIDEAYIQIEHGAKLCERGREFGDAIRRAILEECGLVVSVGVSKNKLLAKIASKLAKPDGLVIIDDDDLERVFRALPSSDLPHCSNKFVKAKLQAHHLLTAWDVRELNAKQLEAFIGLAPKPAMDLCKAAHGVDDAEVIHKVNEKTSLSAQMSLTLTPRPMPNGDETTISATGGRPGWFNPLTCGEHDRIAMTLEALCKDLFEKARVHESFTKRWPSTLTVKFKIHGTSVQYSKNAAFPCKFEDAESSGSTSVAKKATDLAILAVGKRDTELIQHVTVVATNFKSTSGEREKTIEEIVAAEAEPMKKAVQAMQRKRVEDKQRLRAMAKRQRNDRWIHGLEALPPVDVLLALVGGWEREDQCPLEVAELRQAIKNRRKNVEI